MNFGSIKTLIRLTVPAAKDNRVTDASLDSIVNEVVKDISMQLNILRDNAKFNVIADQFEYDLTSDSGTVANFGKFAESGLYWNAGTVAAPDWQRLEPKTMKWLDEEKPNWRDDPSSEPQYYAKDGTKLIVNPPPKSDLDNGFWLYFIKQPTPMVNSTDYPFGADIAEYAILTKAIIKGVEAYLLPMVGQDEKQPNALTIYKALIEDCRAALESNLDIANDEEARMKLPHIC